MPPPLTVCSICSKQVLKAQTYHIGDGKRACKSHPGVLDKKDQLDQQLVAQKKAELVRQEAREESYRQRMREQQPSYWTKPRCWACKQTGITEQDFYTKLLIYMEMQKLLGRSLNPFDPDYPQHIRKALSLKEGEAQLVVVLYPIPSNHPAIKSLDRNGQCAATIGGVVALCPKCAQRLHVEKPPVQLPDLDTVMSIYDLVSPIFKFAASQRLAKVAQAS